MRAQKTVPSSGLGSRLGLFGVLTFASVVALGGLGAACNADRFADDEDGTGGRGRPCERDADCSTGRRCIDLRCVPDRGDCRTDNDCQNDTACACPPEINSERCACVPWGMPPKGKNDMMCAGAGFPVEEFRNPVVKCQWPPAGMAPGYRDVITTPIVIDLEGDGSPEIVFMAGLPASTHLVAISGKDCSVKFDKQTKGAGCSNLAAADLDGDGKVELVGLAANLSVWDYKGDLLADSAYLAAGLLCVKDFPPALVNLDGMGPPEIVVGAAVFRYITTPKPQIQMLWNKNLVEEGAWGTVSTPADLDGDGKVEVVSGSRVWDGITGTDKTPSVMKMLGGGFPAIGDFNADGKPDIALVSSRMDDQKVAIIDYSNNKFIMEPQVAVKGWGGPPTIADFDGDGKPELATAGSAYYYVYSPDCAKSPLPAKCKGQDDGVLWQSETQDVSSGSTGSSVFDFNGDGVAEVVYRDECWLRVFNGPDGKKLFAAPITSGTAIEEPVIADVDGDGHAEIVVSSDGAQNGMCRQGRWNMELGIPHPGTTFGVRVLEDPMDRWSSARPMWNQHAYHITNINDDRTVPMTEMPSWTVHNTYRQNLPGARATSEPRPDGTGRIEFPPDVGDCVKLFKLWGTVCNRGVSPLPKGFPSTFYLGSPLMAGFKALCTAKTEREVEAGDCQPVSCEWTNPSPPPYDLWLRVNDDGKGAMPVNECKAGNNMAHLALSMCPNVPK